MNRYGYTEIVVPREDLVRMAQRAVRTADTPADLAEAIMDGVRTEDRVAANCSWQPTAECGCPAYIAIFGPGPSEEWQESGLDDSRAFDFGAEFDRIVESAFGLDHNGDVVLRVAG